MKRYDLLTSVLLGETCAQRSNHEMGAGVGDHDICQEKWDSLTWRPSGEADEACGG